MTKVKKIVLQLDKKEITLNLQQAKDLKEVLDEMFGEQVVIQHGHHWWWQPNRSPIVYTTGDMPERLYDHVTCSNNTLSIAV